MVPRLLIGERYTANTVKFFLTWDDKQKVGNKKFNQGGT